MPCMFQSPPVMTIHCALSTQLIQRFAGSLPYIFVGDFNIKPDSSMYNLITKGSLEDTDPDVPPPLPGSDWSIDVKAMRSAYKVSLGREPEFTNFAKVRDSEAFIDTLDYVFLSPEWRVESTEPLPERASTSGPLPTEDQPSDHLLLAASLKLD